MKTDEELMLDYKNGNEQSFQTLYGRHSALVYGYLIKRSRNSSAADDIFQSVFLKLHKSRGQYDSNIPFLVWLFTITRSVMIDYFRKQKRTLETFDTEFVEASHSAALSSIPAHITNVLDISAIPERYQSVLKMRYLEDLSFEEMASKLNTSSSNARQLVSRAIRMLRKILGSKAP